MKEGERDFRPINISSSSFFLWWLIFFYKYIVAYVFKIKIKIETMYRQIEIFLPYKIRSVALFSCRDIKLGFPSACLPFWSWLLLISADLHLVYFMKWRCFSFCFLLSGNFHSVVRLKNHKLRNLKDL